MKVDLAYWLSYKTYRVVRVRDPRLGLIHYSVMLIVLVYIGVYIMYLKRGYYQTATSVGEVAVKIKGDSYSINSTGGILPWSSEDLVQPSIERSATFIASSVILTANQFRGLCADPNATCTTNADCPAAPPLDPGVCQNGFCLTNQWCPAENITVNNTAAPGSASEQFSIVGADQLTIWMKATMSFPSLDSQRNYSTVYLQNPILAPDPRQNLFQLGELLRMTGTSYEDIQLRGCILLVKLSWECYLDQSDLCTPTVSALRLDNASLPTGFNFRMPSYYRDPDGTLRRDLFKYTGVRIFFASEGIGYLVSVPTIVLQLSSGLAMMTIATVVSDFMMEYVLPERKRYRKYKYLEVRVRNSPLAFS